MYILKKFLLYDKIARLREPLGLFYRLDNYFFRFLFIHRTLHQGKIYLVKNNLKIAS